MKVLKFKDLNNILKVRLISDFFSELVVTGTMPFMALYLSDIFNTMIAGIFLTSCVILNILSSLLGGYIGDTFNKTKIMIFSQLTLGFFMILMGYSLLNPDYIYVFCISYIFFNIVYGIQYPILESTIMDAIESNANFVYRLEYWLTNVAMAIGALLGGFFYDFNPFIMFFLASIIFILIGLSYKLWLPFASKTNIKTEKNNFFINYSNVLKNKLFLKITLGFSLLLIAELSISTLTAINLKNNFNTVTINSLEINGVSMFSIIMFINTFIIITLTKLIGRTFNSLTLSKQLLIGLILYMLGYISINSFNTIFPLLIAIMLATIGEIVYAPIYNSMKYRIIPNENRSSYLAVSSLGYHFSQVFSRLFLIILPFVKVYQINLLLLCILLLGSILMFFSVKNISTKT